jgi:periplasmic divalent cation tolerance protein
LHSATFFRQARKAKILTGGIHWVFRGLKFEACRRITEKWQLCKALKNGSHTMTEYIQVTTTTETKEDAHKIAHSIVGKRLAACVQVLGPITSVYWWKEKIEEAQEWLCVMKSRQSLYSKLEKAIQGIHPYEVPEIISIPIEGGSKSYSEWLDKELTT